MRRRKNVPFAEILNQLDSKYHNFDGEGFEEEENYDYMDGSSIIQPKMYQADPLVDK